LARVSEYELIAGNAEITQRLANHRLGLTAVINVRGVHEIDAAFKGRAHDTVDFALL
jgi:hypothetical protein